MKNIILTLLIFSSFLSIGQPFDLEKIIPATSSVVLKFNGEAITKKIGMKNINQSPLFTEIAEDLFFFGNRDKKISDLGIDLNHELVYFYNQAENLSYFSFAYAIENPKLFANYIAEKSGLTQTEKFEGYTVLYYENDRELLAWNNSYAIYIYVDFVRGESDEDIDETVIELQEAIEVLEVSSKVEVVTGVVTVVDSAIEDEVVSVEEYEESKEARLERLKKEIDRKKEIKRLKLEVRRKTYQLELNKLFNLDKANSNILSVNNYTQSKNNSADFSFWINANTIGGIYNPYRYGWRYGLNYGAFGLFSSFLNTYLGPHFNGHIFLKDNEIKLESNMAYSKNMKEWMSEVYNSKLPKNYIKYMYHKNILGVSSFSFNSEKLWESFPVIYTDLIYSMSRKDFNDNEKEGVDVLAEFFSVMLDEKALGELFTGKGVFILKDLISTKVEYKTHEYNDKNGEYKEVTKTKTEMTPEFLMIFGSKNKSLITKVLNWACKNEVMYFNNGYYYTDGGFRDFPYKMYFTLQNDMAFISSNLNEIQTIASGKTLGKPSKEIASKMLKNNAYVMVELKELLSKMLQEDLRPKERKVLEYAKNNSETISYFSNFKNGESTIDASLKVPSQFNNSALYLWEFIHEINKIDQGH